MPRISKELLIEMIEKGHPVSLDSLRNQLATRQIDFVEDELLSIIQRLDTDGVIALRRSSRPSSFLAFLSDFSRTWQVYATALLSLVETILVIYASGISLALPLRLTLGIWLLGFLPGYFTARAMFPEKKLPVLEGILLDIFLSVLISAGAGILLGTGSFFNPAFNVLTLSLYTELMALVATYRAYVTEKRLPPDKFAVEGQLKKSSSING